MRRASEMAHISKIVQIGIRGIGSSQLSDFQDAEAYGNTIITSREVRRNGVEWVASCIPQAEHYYISFDIDGLDPSIAIGTGSPFLSACFMKRLRPSSKLLRTKAASSGWIWWKFPRPAITRI